MSSAPLVQSATDHRKAQQPDRDRRQLADWGDALRFNPVSTQVGANGQCGNALSITDALQYRHALPTSSVERRELIGQSRRGAG